MRSVGAMILCLVAGCNANPPSSQAKQAIKPVEAYIEAIYTNVVSDEPPWFVGIHAGQSDDLVVTVSKHFDKLSDEERQKIGLRLKDKWESTVQKKELRVRFVNEDGKNILVVE
jgi:hypothetical protein